MPPDCTKYSRPAALLETMTAVGGLRLIAMMAMTVAARPVIASGPACASGEPDFSAGQAYHYEGIVSLSPDRGRIAADWTIYVNQPEREQLTFLLNEAIGQVAIAGPDVIQFAVGPGEGVLGNVTRVDVTLRPAEGSLRIFEMSYSGNLFDPTDQSGINTVAPDKIELTVDSFWLPFDSRFSQRLTATMEIVAPGDWMRAISTGCAELTESGARVVNTQPQLDIAVTMLSSARSKSGPGYQVFDTRSGARDLSSLVQAAEFCVGYLNERFGEREPLPTATIVVHDRSEAGYARGTLIALTDVPDVLDDEALMFICHEFSHFWSSNGNPGAIENWLNESFAEYAGVRAVGEARGEAAAEAILARFRAQLDDAGPQPPIWTPGETERRPYLVNYRKGPLALAALEARIGRVAFDRFMRRYMVERIATTPDLLAMLEEVAGAEYRAWFEALLQDSQAIP
jgi:hypothetical protein